MVRPVVTGRRRPRGLASRAVIRGGRRGGWGRARAAAAVAAPALPGGGTGAVPAVASPGTTPGGTPGPTPEATPTTVGAEEAAGVLVGALRGLVEGFLANLPLLVVGLIVLVVGVAVAAWLARGAERALRRTATDVMVVDLSARLVRLLTVIAFALLALSVAGVPVGAALASLGIAGLALAFALQNILENFVAGILLLMRKPFRAGDQIRTGEFEGTVEHVDLRVTRLLSFGGLTVLIPNADVFTSPLTNLTTRGIRRTSVTVGVDYRDDHDRAREVILEAVRGVEEVLDTPEPEVLCTALGDSSVDFEVRFWSLPRNIEVMRASDAVLRAVKTAIAEAGMTIPWPIRTLSFDNPLRLGDGRGRSSRPVPRTPGTGL